ncbi:hypothetical protein ACFC26_12445 [Kitasatospora purpeofusca]|uniref:hypothetical protein n=1 Tax=Kitasatospora purpeofusca TaxID=67352 RepID=UPI0035DA267B
MFSPAPASPCGSVSTSSSPRTAAASAPEIADWVTWYSGLPAFVDPDPERAYWTVVGGPILVANAKLGAAAYVDDRAIHHSGDWTDTLATVRRAVGLDCIGTPVRA